MALLNSLFVVAIKVMIKEYFANYFLHTVILPLTCLPTASRYNRTTEPWLITLVDTGESTMTGGRLKRVSNYLKNDTFCFTYGDGLADINIANLISFHRTQGRQATLTAVQPPGRFGSLAFERGKVYLLMKSLWVMVDG